jgi:hypothetical protein
MGGKVGKMCMGSETTPTAPASKKRSLPGQHDNLQFENESNAESFYGGEEHGVDAYIANS